MAGRIPGGGVVQRAIDPDWSGEDDSFDVDHLWHLPWPLLEELAVEIASPGIDLAPLTSLPRLKRFSTRALVESMTPLLSLPALTDVPLRHDGSDESLAVVAVLVARGVVVEAL